MISVLVIWLLILVFVTFLACKATYYSQDLWYPYLRDPDLWDPGLRDPDLWDPDLRLNPGLWDKSVLKVLCPVKQVFLEQTYVMKSLVSTLLS